MKILQIIDSLPNTSGGARFVVNLSKKLSQRGLEVTVLLIDGKHSHFLQELKEAGIKVIALDVNTKSRYKPKYVRQIAAVIAEYDIVHVHVFPASYLVAFATFLSEKSTPVVFTEHSSFNNRASNFAFRYIEKFVYSRFSKIICLSEQVREFIRVNLNTPSGKLAIIENAIDCEAVFNAVPYTKGELSYSDSDFLLLMSARLSRPKNHNILFEALSLLDSSTKLLVAGDGEMEKELKRKANELMLNDRITFLASRDDIFRLMKAVDINILVSDFEGLSLAALESMSSGKPFIASNVDGLDFVVQDERLLFTNTAENIAAAINRLRNDTEWRKEAAAISLRRSLDFDIEKMVDKYLSVYINSTKEKDV